MNNKQSFVLLLVVIVPLFACGISNHGLWGSDEPRVAEIGREMALTGNWAVPTLNQNPFLEQPPLYYASLAVTFRMLGVSDRVARIPSALFGMGGAVALFFLASMFFGPRVGLLSAFVMSTSFEYFQIAHWVLVDSALTCFVICAMAFFTAGYRSADKKKKLFHYVLMYLSCTLAFYSKGFIGIAIPALGVLTFLLFERNPKELLSMHLWLGVLLFVALTLPWFLALWQQGGATYLHAFLVDNHLGRFVRPGVLGHAKPFYFYLIDFPPGFGPWIALIIPVLYLAFIRVKELPPDSRKGLLFAKCWFFTGFMFLSMASGKRLLYTLPIFAPLSMLTAFYIDSTLKARSMRAAERFFIWILGLFPLAVGVAAVPLYFRFTKGGLSQALPGAPFAVWAFSCVAVGFALISLRYLLRRDVRRFWISHGATIFVLLMFLLVALLPVVDGYRSIKPFCEQVKAFAGQGKALYGFQADERLRGLLPFYTGHYLGELETLDQVREALSREQQVVIVARDAGGSLERQLLSTGRLYVHVRRLAEHDHSFVLLSNASPAQEKRAE